MILIQLLLLLLIIIVTLVPTRSFAEKCTICPSGEPIREDMQGKEISISGYEFVKNCGELESILGSPLGESFFESNSEGCRMIQASSSLCGCPISEGACYLCGGSVGQEEQQKSIIPNRRNIVVKELEEEFEGISPTCELVEAYLHSIQAGNDQCSEWINIAHDRCCCDDQEGNSAMSIDDYSSLSPGTMNNTKDETEYCYLCLGDDASVQWPTKNITKFVQDLGLTSLFDDENYVTCADLELKISTNLTLNNPLCQPGDGEWMVSLQGLCGCPQPEDHCRWDCVGATEYTEEGVIEVPWPEVRQHPGLVEYYNFPFNPTCEEFTYLIRNFRHKDAVCLGVRFFNHFCGCNKGERIYMGAKTKIEKMMLAWAPRVTGCFSLIGSILMIRNVIRDPLKRHSTYHQLALCLGTFDLFNSISWILSSLPEPIEIFPGVDGEIYGAMGNDRTCTAQGFFVQLGFTGIFYNMSLSFYYLMVIKFGIQEGRLKKLRWLLHVPPLVTGLGLAFAGIPFYNNAWFYCHIAPPPTYDWNWAPILIFSIIPISCVMVVVLVNMMILYLHVRKQDRAANRWRMSIVDPRLSITSLGITNLTNPKVERKSFIVSNNRRSSNMSHLQTSTSTGVGGGHKTSRLRSSITRSRTNRNSRYSIHTGRRGSGGGDNRLTKAILYQALLYLIGFLVTWPIYFAGNFMATNNSYAFWLCMVTLNPLQGFFNALVYFRSRVRKMWEKVLQFGIKKLEEFRLCCNDYYCKRNGKYEDNNSNKNNWTVDKSMISSIKGSNKIVVSKDAILEEDTFKKSLNPEDLGTEMSADNGNQHDSSVIRKDNNVDCKEDGIPFNKVLSNDLGNDLPSEKESFRMDSEINTVAAPNITSHGLKASTKNDGHKDSSINCSINNNYMDCTGQNKNKIDKDLDVVINMEQEIDFETVTNFTSKTFETSVLQKNAINTNHDCNDVEMMIEEGARTTEETALSPVIHSKLALEASSSSSSSSSEEDDDDDLKASFSRTSRILDDALASFHEESEINNKKSYSSFIDRKKKLYELHGIEYDENGHNESLYSIEDDPY